MSGQHDVRCGAQEDLALDQRLAHQAEFVVFEIAQPAMDQLGRPARGVAGQIVLLGQQHRQPAPRGVARDPGTIDAAADDQEIDLLAQLLASRRAA